MAIQVVYIYSESIAINQLDHWRKYSAGVALLPLVWVVYIGSSLYLLFLIFLKLEAHASIAYRLIEIMGPCLFAFMHINTYSRRSWLKRLNMVKDSYGKNVKIAFEPAGVRRTIAERIGTFFPWIDVERIVVVDDGLFVDIKRLRLSYWVPDADSNAPDVRHSLLELAKQQGVNIIHEHPVNLRNRLDV